MFKPLLLASLISLGCQSALATEPTPAKNVILLISDGAGMHTWNAASYYRHGALGQEAYDKFDVQLFMSTHPLNTSSTPTKSKDNAVEFDSKALWTNETNAKGFKGKKMHYPAGFTGYDYATSNYTDSAAAATALASGYKTYNSAINWSNDDTRLKNIGEYVVESGRALGVITSVQWSHATPSGFLAHNNNRSNYEQIAQEVVESGLANVVMGAGHPEFDDNGKAREPKNDKAYRFVGGKALWEKLKAGETKYRLIDKKEDFQALAEKRLEINENTKILGTAPVANTLQFSREGQAGGQKLETSPDLATMTQGALNVVSQDKDGFFLMVEGGAVDWAAHANNLPRLIEEQIDFNRAVETAVEWVEKNSSWDETLIIVTTDHGNGLLQGPDADKNLYAPIISQGAGALPLVRWHTDNHTRELVPLYAKGKGADFFYTVAKPEPLLGKFYQVEEKRQQFVDNTNVFDAAAKAMGIKTDKQ